MSRQQLSNRYLSAMCMELHLVLQSGISMEEGLNMLLEEEQDREAAAMLQRVRDVVQMGEPLYAGLEQESCFPLYLKKMVEIGEKTGNLDRVLHTLSRHYDRQAETAQNLKNAVLYPAVLLCMMLLVVGVLLTTVLPIFEDVYRQLGTTMTGVTAAVMRLGMLLKENWLTVLVILLAVIVGAVVFVRVKKGGSLVQLCTGKKISRLIAEERFASAMAMTLASGFDVDEAMTISGRLCEDAAMAGRIEACQGLLAQGAELVAAVTQSGVLSKPSARMLGIGVRTGTTDAVLQDIAERTQRQIQEETESMISRIEPTLVILMSVLVGGILLAVMLPLMGILTTLG